MNTATKRTSAAPQSSPAVKRIPDGFRTVTPHLICAGAAEAIAFYQAAFGAIEIARIPGPGGKLIHAAIRIGDSIVMLVDEFPDMGAASPLALKGSSVTIHLYVENADAAFERAVKAGATVQMPLEDRFWGDRYGQLTDPFGHAWSIATHVRDLTSEQIAENMKQAGC